VLLSFFCNVRLFSIQDSANQSCDFYQGPTKDSNDFSLVLTKIGVFLSRKTFVYSGGITSVRGRKNTVPLPVCIGTWILIEIACGVGHHFNAIPTVSENLKQNILYFRLWEHRLSLKNCIRVSYLNRGSC
jgi:hypothetical protein